jgi:hypothetical protein
VPASPATKTRNQEPLDWAGLTCAFANFPVQYPGAWIEHHRGQQDLQIAATYKTVKPPIGRQKSVATPHLPYVSKVRRRLCILEDGTLSRLSRATLVAPRVTPAEMEGQADPLTPSDPELPPAELPPIDPEFTLTEFDPPVTGLDFPYIDLDLSFLGLPSTALSPPVDDTSSPVQALTDSELQALVEMPSTPNPAEVQRLPSEDDFNAFMDQYLCDPLSTENANPSFEPCQSFTPLEFPRQSFAPVEFPSQSFVPLEHLEFPAQSLPTLEFPSQLFAAPAISTHLSFPTMSFVPPAVPTNSFPHLDFLTSSFMPPAVVPTQSFAFLDSSTHSAKPSSQLVPTKPSSHLFDPTPNADWHGTSKSILNGLDCAWPPEGVAYYLQLGTLDSPTHSAKPSSQSVPASHLFDPSPNADWHGTSKSILNGLDCAWPPEGAAYTLQLGSLDSNKSQLPTSNDDAFDFDDLDMVLMGGFTGCALDEIF